MSKETSDWKSLPANVVQNFLEYLTVSDAQNVLATCKPWNLEADFYLKDKVWLCIDKINSLGDVKSCKRRFENIKSKGLDQSYLYIKALVRRDVKYAKRITAAIIAYDNLRTLLGIACEIGANLKSLTLINQTNDARLKRPMNGRDLQSLFTTKLSNVEELKIDEVNRYFPLPRSFGNVKYLEISELSWVKDLEDFLKSNSLLEALIVKSIRICDANYVFQHMNNLKSITTDDYYFTLDIVRYPLQHPLQTLSINTLISPERLLNIARNFKDLQCLSIKCLPSDLTGKSLNAIWRMPKLVSFSFAGWFEYTPWMRSFKAPNTSVKKLSIQGACLDEKIVIACSKNFPNVMQFEVLDIKKPSFRYIQGIGKNCKHLQFLSLSLTEEMSFKKVLKYQPPAFEELIELRLRTNSSPRIDDFLKYFNAPNLMTISFVVNSDEVSESDRTSFCTNMRKVINSLLPAVKITIRFESAPEKYLHR